MCSASGSYKFAPRTITSQNACGLRTEAVWVQPTPQLQNLPSAITYSGTTGVATFNLWTVEVGSTSNNVEGNVDSFQTRVLPHPFQVQQSKYGSVVIPIDAGDMLPPLISRVHPRFKTPWLITIITGIVVAFSATALAVALLLRLFDATGSVTLANEAPTESSAQSGEV